MRRVYDLDNPQMATSSSSDNLTGLAASSDNPTGLGGDYDLEELEGHARVWLDRPFDVSTIMFQVGKVAEQQLLPRPFLHVL